MRKTPFVFLLFQSHRAEYGVALLLLVYDAVNSLALIIICCELSQRTSEAFEGINDILMQYKWYLFPMELKRILPTMIITAQQPILLECFGSISCCRDCFKKVCEIFVFNSLLFSS